MIDSGQVARHCNAATSADTEGAHGSSAGERPDVAVPIAATGEQCAAYAITGGAVSRMHGGGAPRVRSPTAAGSGAAGCGACGRLERYMGSGGTGRTPASRRPPSCSASRLRRSPTSTSPGRAPCTGAQAVRKLRLGFASTSGTGRANHP